MDPYQTPHPRAPQLFIHGVTSGSPMKLAIIIYHQTWLLVIRGYFLLVLTMDIISILLVTMVIYYCYQLLPSFVEITMVIRFSR